MAGYTKLFESIIRSSIWAEDSDTLRVWITMLALKDRHHIVDGTVESLARMAKVEEGVCERALAKFMGPDPRSRSKENEGRRVQVIDNGWLILNGEKYAKMLSWEERREYNRIKQAEFRKRKKLLVDQAKGEGGYEAIKEGMEGADLQGSV